MDYDLYRILPMETGNEFPMDNIRHFMKQLLTGVFQMHRVRAPFVQCSRTVGLGADQSSS